MLHFPIFLLLLQLSTFKPIYSSEYTPPVKYFINCGSSTNFSDGRVFVGDDSESPFKLSHGQSKSVKDNHPSSSTPLLYQTARVYQHPSSYELEVDKTGTYFVRLHFFSFSSSSFNLSDAVFNVSASGFSLLSNFSVKNSTTTSTSTTLPVKEFLLTITQGKFSLYFVPSHESSFAFVNAIEVFPTPDSFIQNSTSRVTSSGSNGNYSGLLSLVLHTVDRINVGGSKITPENDTLWRTWIEDDAYLTSSKAVVHTKFYNSKLNYRSGKATTYTAPNHVYKSAKFLNVMNSSKQANFSKLDWSFQVRENVTQHLVRFHFCDIFSQAIDYFNFSLFVNKFERSIDPYLESGNVAAPFYLDFVVDSNGSRSINISIGLKPQNASNPSAFLNGLEIFEIQNNSGSVPPPSQPKNKQRKALLVGFVLSSVVIVGLLGLAFLLFKRRRAKLDRNNGAFLYAGSSSHEKQAEGTALNLSLKISFADIQKATGKFHEKFLIGEGGFGKVYQGTLRGTKVAVKRSKPGHGQGLAEFQTEILVLSQIRHRHLVSLIGYCDERSEMILVYEFMEKGTLRDHLYNSKGEPQGSSSKVMLSWKKRLEICIGAARGLDYLHSDSTNGILHRDVKSTNILLDENYDAKVADFGLSKSGITDPNNESMVLKGSFGYFDPEYIKSSQYTVKSDVYSFGVVLLEVICARPAIFTLSEEEDNVSLAKWAMTWQKKGQLEKIIDPSLVGDISPNSFRVVGELAEKCLRESGFERPTMNQVVWGLNYALQLQRSVTRGGPSEDTATNTSLESAFPAIRCAAFPDEDDEIIPSQNLQVIQAHSPRSST